MKRPAEPLFLARQGYRRRRLADAARLLPIVGAVLLLEPLLGTVEGGRTTAGTGLYIFGVWLGLILGAVGLSRGLGRSLGEKAGDKDGSG